MQKKETVKEKIEKGKALIKTCGSIHDMEKIARQIPRIKPLEQIFLDKMLSFAPAKREQRCVLSYARPTSRFAVRLGKNLDPAW